MTPTLLASAEKQLTVYSKLSKQFIQARRDLARGQAETVPEHATYWQYIAEGCEKLLDLPVSIRSRGK